MTSHYPSRSMPLVTGATGNVGTTLTELLVWVDLGFKLKCRRSEKSKAWCDQDVEAVHGALTDPDSVRTAPQGCDQALLLLPFTPAMYEHSVQIFDSAREAGVRRIVKAIRLRRQPAALSTLDRPPRTRRRSPADRLDAAEASAYMGALLQLASAIRRGQLPGTSSRGATTWIDSTPTLPPPRGS